MDHTLKALPDHVQKVLLDLVDTVKAVSSENLKSVILYGSAAEGSLDHSSLLLNKHIT